MNIAAFRPGRRHAARRLAETQLLGDPMPSPELSLPDALAELEAQNAAPVLAPAQQPLVTYAPPAALPPVPQFRPRPGTNPYPAPARQGPPPTQAWAPEYARPAAQHARPYVPQNRLRPLSPATPMLILFRNPRARRQALTAAQERVEQVSYPVIDIRDHNGQRDRYAALMRHYDAITGTRSPFTDPDAVYRFRYSDGTYRDGPAWPAPSAPEVPQRGRAITAGGAS